jgi:NAD(P)-dependent dehydrogenase (short-subunit alcohol dehydrogenase family)
MSKLALEHVIERGSGWIVSISSIIGQTGNIGQANYAAAKSGMFGQTMTMARGPPRRWPSKASSTTTGSD